MLSVALGAKVIVTRSSAMLNIQRGNRASPPLCLMRIE
jgi:hypothetical protein